MRSATISSFLALALLSGAYALPFAGAGEQVTSAVYANGNSCYQPPSQTITTYVTESQSTPTRELPTTSISPAEPTSELEPSAGCRPISWVGDGRAHSVGTLRAALIFVDFPDMPANTTTEELYELVEAAPAELFNEMSYGKLTLELVPLLDQFYRMPAESSSYNYSRALTTEAHLKYINDALTAVGPSVSFAGIDVLYVLPAKYANEISFSTSTAIDVTAADGTVIGSSITYGQDLYFSWGFKTVNHETGHTMGLPDLYPYSGGEVPQWVGGFDIMGLIGSQSPDYFAWHKWRLGWIDDNQVDCIVTAGKTTHRISPIEVAGETSKLVAVPLDSTAYVLAEVRSNLGIDGDACGMGVLLYTADAAVGSGDGPIRVIDTKPNSGGCDLEKGGELNDAPLGAGSSYDTGLGVTITVMAQEGDDYIIEVDSQI